MLAICLADSSPVFGIVDPSLLLHSGAGRCVKVSPEDRMPIQAPQPAAPAARHLEECQAAPGQGTPPNRTLIFPRQRMGRRAVLSFTKDLSLE
jgi:hypothetical protein